ncbi:MAG TPA: hypothetical protein VFG79_24970 [Solirubrobacter sp.]|nr:hypothetical protein [Solirubrobacter sp.]
MPNLRRPVLVAVAVSLLLPAAARADDLSDQWLPRSDGAQWLYEWSNSDYSPTPRRELYTIQSRAGTAFRIRWQEQDPSPDTTPSAGTMDFQETDAGLANLTYQSSQPPPQFPVLCVTPSECGNSVAGAFYMLVWGSRSRTLAEPLLRGTRWSALGGASNDVSSASRYIGRERVSVPAFPGGVVAARVDSDITQAGAIGDPFGSGVRTVWWVRGVGPVRIVLRHRGGATSQASLISTSLTPLPMPPDESYLPLNRGDRMVFRWRNNRHMRRWSRQQFDVAEVLNASARVDVKQLSGPISVAGGYSFATRLSGISQLQALTKVATRAKFPRLGPRGRPASERRRFFTPFDFMTYGFSPVIPTYPKKGDTWRSSRDTPDWTYYGVTGKSRVVGTRRVRTPAGRFTAIVVRSKLRQAGYPFGSGRRTMWFAAGKGLVKLVFRHRDGSVSTVERLR